MAPGRVRSSQELLVFGALAAQIVSGYPTGGRSTAALPLGRLPGASARAR